MSRVLVTVGTTPFPRLIRWFDRPSSRHEIILQTATPSYHSAHWESFPFSDEIERWYAWADLVVTHAGAGSVYSLLERGRRIAVVPNLDRADTHQMDLAMYVRTERYAYVVPDLDAFTDADRLVDEAISFDARPYVKRPFTAATALLRLLHHGTPPPGRS